MSTVEINDRSILVRISSRFLDRIKEIAQREDRSVAYVVRRILVEGVGRQEQSKQ